MRQNDKETKFIWGDKGFSLKVNDLGPDPLLWPYEQWEPLEHRMCGTETQGPRGDLRTLL